MNTSILLVGRPHSTKTTYLAQLYSRLQKGMGVLTLYKPVENLSAIKGARAALAMGDEVATTPTEERSGITFPVSESGRQVDVECPDYGGEQINQIVSTREVDDKWFKSIQTSDNWILFIRITSVQSSYDLTTSSINGSDKSLEAPNKSEHGEPVDNIPVTSSLSDQTFFIELLQIFLYVKGQDAHFRNAKSRLTVVLTCWDELHAPGMPKDALEKHLPLLFSFLTSNWIVDNLKILGMSAQGFKLDIPENKEKYKTEGPEKFGYLIKADGKEESDLTRLISEALS